MALGAFSAKPHQVLKNCKAFRPRSLLTTDQVGSDSGSLRVVERLELSET